MKVFITASSTVGKSTVAKELQRRGYTAIDGDDEPGLARIEIQATGEPVEWPKGYVDWTYYAWNLQEPVLRRVLEQSDVVFLAGIYGNQREYYHLFDKLIALTITPEAFKERLDNRPRREHGDSEENMQKRLEKYPILLQRFLDSGFTPIDASGTPTETVDAILEFVNPNEG